jgi:hypothetical protein
MLRIKIEAIVLELGYKNVVTSYRMAHMYVALEKYPNLC